MELKGKALFNLLKMNLSEGEASSVEPWQVEDLRSVQTEPLFARLQKLGVALDADAFCAYAENCESPEELIECLWDDEENLKGHDKAYLIIFELWRRLLPDQMCLSIFCDELDHLFELYDNGTLVEESHLQNALLALENILDNSSDANGNPQEVFSELAGYCAHDLERFLFDYILDQIEMDNATYASELIDDFFDYITEKKRFDFLRAHVVMVNDMPEGNILFERLLDDIAENPDVELLTFIGESLVHRGDVRLFMLSIKQALPHLKSEEQFQDILTMVAEYFRCLDREEEENAVKQILTERASHPLDQPFTSSEQAVSHFTKLLKVLPN